MVTDQTQAAPTPRQTGKHRAQPGASSERRPSPRPGPRTPTADGSPAAARGVTPSGRFRALDGLRGFAAIVVLVHHSFLTVPALAAPYHDPVERAHGFAWVMAYTPLHLVWAGTEAVYVFFVLSGFVLVLPLVRGGSFSWRGYYPKRLARLYLPIWGALALSVGIIALVPRHTKAGASWWLNLHDQAVTGHTVLTDALAIFGFDQLNSALWSLRYEIAFSLALPVYVLVCRRLFPHRLLLLKIVGTVALCAVGQAGGRPTLTIIPIFLIGGFLAADRHAVQAWVGRLGTAAGGGLSVLAGLGLVAPWLASMPGKLSKPVDVAAVGLQLFAATLIVVLFMGWAPAVRAGTSTVGTWLGRRSFSLYLVHEPIVVSVALLLGPGRAGWTLPVAAPIALVAAELFYRAVEGPSHRFSQWIGSVTAR